MRDKADWTNLQQENRELREQVVQRDELVNHLQQCAVNLKPIEEQIKEHLRKADVLHEDETGTYVIRRERIIT